MNILIVESKNDKHFVEALIRHLHLQPSLSVSDASICTIDDFECLDGSDQTKLTTALSSLFARVRKNDIEKIGILIDLDNKSVENHLELVNNAIQQAVFDDFEINFSEKLNSVSNFVKIQIDTATECQIACFFTNVDGRGELETVLKAIKTQDSTFADCLEAWQQCLLEKGKTAVSQKEFDKFWLNNYIRFDTCATTHRKQAERKCSMRNFDFVLENKPRIFNFDDDILSDLKNFLHLF